MKQNEITISLSGMPGVGKSTLMFELEKMLVRKGFKAKVEESSFSEDEYTKDWMKMQHKRLKEVKKRKIKIVEKWTTLDLKSI